MRRTLVKLAFVVMAASAVAVAVRAVRVDPAAHAATSVLRALVAVAFAAAVARRVPARRRTTEPLAYAACFVAVISLLLISPPGDGAPAARVLAGDLVALAGIGWLLASALALGTCFGVLPEARGLVTRGPYGLVRHPVYLGELVAAAGLLLASPTWVNAGLALVFAVAQLVRMRLEEAELVRVFPAYRAYAAAVPRLVPRLPVQSLVISSES
jgi:protein-S-isoprenylcysteine O-methyltransferase Ste14